METAKRRMANLLRHSRTVAVKGCSTAPAATTTCATRRHTPGQERNIGVSAMTYRLHVEKDLHQLVPARSTSRTPCDPQVPIKLNHRKPRVVESGNWIH